MSPSVKKKKNNDLRLNVNHFSRHGHLFIRSGPDSESDGKGSFDFRSSFDPNRFMQEQGVHVALWERNQVESIQKLRLRWIVLQDVGEGVPIFLSIVGERARNGDDGRETEKDVLLSSEGSVINLIRASLGLKRRWKTRATWAVYIRQIKRAIRRFDCKEMGAQP